MSFEGRLRKLEDAARPEPEDEYERQKRLKDVREAAEQENERFFRELTRERSTGYFEQAGYSKEAVEAVRGEDFITEEDSPPFTIIEDVVFCARDGKQVTSPKVHAELYYWEFREGGYNPRGLIHDEEAQAYYMPEPPHELAFSRDSWHLARYFWALGDDRAYPY
jgi:hypothetical protein